MSKIVMLGAFDVAGGFANWRRLLGGTENFRYYVERESSNHYEDTASEPHTLRDALDDASVIFYVCAVRDAHVPEVVVNDKECLGVPMAEYRDKTVIWLRGSNSLRANADKYKVGYEQYKSIVCSTPDLCHMFGGTWMPNPVVLDFIEPQANKNTDEIICAQYPTDRKIKNTEEFKLACHYLEKQHDNFKGKIKTGTYAEVMAHKIQTASIVFDHMQGYYSVNAMEAAWAGCATLASLWPEYMPIYQRFTKTWTLPFINVTNIQELRVELDRLICNQEDIKAEARRERRWMETFWNGGQHIANLEQIIERNGGKW